MFGKLKAQAAAAKGKLDEKVPGATAAMQHSRARARASRPPRTILCSPALSLRV